MSSRCADLRSRRHHTIARRQKPVRDESHGSRRPGIQTRSSDTAMCGHLALGQLSNRDGPISRIAEELQQVLDLRHSEKFEPRYGSDFFEGAAPNGKDLFADSIG